MFDQATAWQARYKNCGFSSNSLHAECVAFTNAGGSFATSTRIRWYGPPAAWVRKDNECDAAVPPTNGAAGTCTDTLASGSTCQPECDSGYTVSGATSCTDRILTAATCTAAVASCTATQYLTGGACASCPSGSVSRGGNSTICYCPENHYRDAGVCVECGRNTYRAAGDVVPGPAGAAATECFTRVDHEAWTEATRLTNRYTSGDYSFGESIAIDGVHIVVGTTDSNANGGTVDWYRNYGVFQRTLGEVGDGLNFGSGGYAGHSLAVSQRDTNTAWIMVGAWGSVFPVSCSSTAEQCSQGTMSTPSGAVLFGHSVAMDGETVVVGASGMNIQPGFDTIFDTNINNQGAAYVFTPQTAGDPTAWVLRVTLRADDGGGGDQFGRSVAISGDTIVVGAPGDVGPGGSRNTAAYVFTRADPGSPTSNWTQTAKLQPNGYNIGRSVSVDGNIIAVYGQEVSVYVLNTPGDPTSWALEATISQSNGFGLGVIVKDYNLVVTEPSNDGGAVFIFSRDPATKTWSQRKKFIGERSTFARYGVAFGTSLATQPTLIVATKELYLDDTDIERERGLAVVYSTDAVQICAGQICSGGNGAANPPPPPPALILDDDDFAVGTDGGRAVAVATACALAVIALIGGDMDTTSARGSNPASNATGHPGLAGRISRRRTGCGRRGASGGMASAWLVMAVLTAHVASVNAVFRPVEKSQLVNAVNACLTNVNTGDDCCRDWVGWDGCYVDAGTGTVYDDIGDWDTSLITDMSSLFANRASFNADISGWDTSQVTNMESMFGDAFVFNQNISSWNTSQVTDMTRMFNYAEAFNQPIGTWDTSKVDTMAYMFSGAFAFNQPIGSWDTSQVTEMQQMFKGDSKPSAFNQPIGNWDTSKVTTMNGMFRGGGATYAFNQPIGNWDTSRVTDMKEMFNNAYDFNQDVTGWDTTSLSDSTRMFDDADAWQARYARSPSSTDGPPSAWSRIANECDAAVPIDNGAAGTCTDTLASGSTCQPECDSGYTVSGATSCTDRVLTAATCTAAVASCTTTQYLTGGACASCPDGSVSRGGDSTICYCPENFYRVVDAGAAGGYDCSACDAGQYRGPGDAVPTAASSASTRCFAKLNHDAWNGIKTIRSEDPYVLRYDKDLGKDVAIDVDHIIVLASADIDETYDYSRFNWYSRDPPPIHKESFGERSSVLVGGGAAFRDGSVAVSSISTNGAWVVVGSPRTNQAFVYLCSMLPTPGCNSATMAQPFGGPGYFGHSVAIDGNTLVVGESALGGANAGVVHVYTHTHPTGDPTGWILRATLQADDGRSYDEFGRSVAISGDTIVVGAPGFTPNGVAYVFTRTDAGSPTATWTQTAKLRPSFTDTNTYGQSVSVDGNLAAVGCYLKEKASVFVRDLPGDPTSSWSLEATLGTDDEDKHGHVSAKVVVKDYNLFVAAPGDPTHASSQSGAVLVFSRDPATKTWAKLRELNSEKPIGTRDNFGRSIAFDATSDHGPTLVAGAYHPDDTLRGAAYVFATDAAQSCAGQICSGGSSAPSGAGGNDTANPPPPPPALILDDDDFAVGTDGGRAVAVATACALAVIALMG